MSFESILDYGLLFTALLLLLYLFYTLIFPEKF